MPSHLHTLRWALLVRIRPPALGCCKFMLSSPRESPYSSLLHSICCSSCWLAFSTFSTLLAPSSQFHLVFIRPLRESRSCLRRTLSYTQSPELQTYRIHTGPPPSPQHRKGGEPAPANTLICPPPRDQMPSLPTSSLFPVSSTSASFLALSASKHVHLSPIQKPKTKSFFEPLSPATSSSSLSCLYMLTSL